MVGAGLTDSRAWLELIADGHHVHPAAMQLCYQCAADRTLLITDAMRAAGMPDGNYEICGYDVEMRAGVVRTASGSLAGSTLSLDAAVRNIVRLTDCAAQDAIHMASRQPARMLGIDDRLGSITPGKQANLIALNGDLFVEHIWLNGQIFPQ